MNPDALNSHSIEVLVVLPKDDHDRYDIIRDVVEQAFEVEEKAIHVELYKSASEALTRLSDPKRYYRMVISSLRISEDRISPIDSRGGLQFIKQIREIQGLEDILCVLLTPTIDKGISSAINDMACKYVLLSVNTWEDDLLNLCVNYSSKDAQENAAGDDQLHLQSIYETSEENTGKIDIYLMSDCSRSFYTIKSPGYNVPCEPIRPDTMMLDDLVHRCNTFKKNKWQDELRFIGLHVVRQLKNNSQFAEHFSNVIASCGGEQNARIRFIIEEKLHPIVLEALCKETELTDESYYMLHMPIYRSANVTTKNSPLFKDPETRQKPINCLIINANTSGKCSGIKDSKGDDLFLQSLNNCDMESETLNDYLTQNKKRFNIGNIEFIDFSRSDLSFSEIQKSDIGCQHWHLVHFAGHSHYDDNNKKAYVFLPGDIGPEPLPIDDFTLFLRKIHADFIYLSSCESSRSTFAFELAKHHIPALVGYRWDIDDDKAAEHAKLFYTNLFEKDDRSLENAFFRTRKQMHDAYRDNWIWAAAMLLIQL